MQVRIPKRAIIFYGQFLLKTPIVSWNVIFPKKLLRKPLMRLSGIFWGKVMVGKGLQSYELKQVFHGKTSVMCIVKLSFPFSRWRLSKVGESEQEMHRIRPTHIQASRSLCSLAHTHSNNVTHSVQKLACFQEEFKKLCFWFIFTLRVYLNIGIHTTNSLH